MSASTAAAVALGWYSYQYMQAKRSAPKKVILRESEEELALELCEYVVGVAKEAIEARGKCYMALAGGSLLDFLVGLPAYKDQVDFSKLVIVFADHKCISPIEEGSTSLKVKVKFGDKAGIEHYIEPFQHPVQGSDGQAEARYYAKVLKDSGIPHTSKGLPIVDLVILGLGADGRVASCLPESEAVHVTEKSVTASNQHEEPRSITLTIPAMNQARHRCIVACGGSKGMKEAVKRAMKRPAERPRGKFPAQLIHSPTFFLDKQAAANL